MEWAAVQENVPEVDSIFVVKRAGSTFYSAVHCFRIILKKQKEHPFVLLSSLSTLVNYATMKRE